MNELIERLRTAKWEVTDDCDRMPDDPAAKCVFVDMRPAEFQALLREAAAALESAMEDACVSLVADIRLACGDNGKRMQPELVEYIRGLALDAARYRWLRDNGPDVVGGITGDGFGVILRWPDVDIGASTLDAAIDQAMKEQA